ncbi:MAG: hypothetical protein IJ158_00705 [Treponema sp.]|nr:hypothetical protein [Treponema sp.]
MDTENMTPEMKEIVESFNAQLAKIREQSAEYTKEMNALQTNFMVKIEELQKQQAIEMKEIVESFNAQLANIREQSAEYTKEVATAMNALQTNFMVKIEEVQKQQAIKTRKLSQKEQNSIIALKQLGWTNAEIAKMLDIDEKTIESSEDFLKQRQSVSELRKRAGRWKKLPAVLKR